MSWNAGNYLYISAVTCSTSWNAGNYLYIRAVTCTSSWNAGNYLYIRAVTVTIRRDQNSWRVIGCSLSVTILNSWIEDLVVDMLSLASKAWVEFPWSVLEVDDTKLGLTGVPGDDGVAASAPDTADWLPWETSVSLLLSLLSVWPSSWAGYPRLSALSDLHTVRSNTEQSNVE